MSSYRDFIVKLGTTVPQIMLSSGMCKFADLLDQHGGIMLLVKAIAAYFVTEIEKEIVHLFTVHNSWKQGEFNYLQEFFPQVVAEIKKEQSDKCIFDVLLEEERPLESFCELLEHCTSHQEIKLFYPFLRLGNLANRKEHNGKFVTYFITSIEPLAICIIDTYKLPYNELNLIGNINMNKINENLQQFCDFVQKFNLMG